MATITWGGSTDGSWNAGSNWVGGVAPGAGDAAVIATGTAVISGGSLATVGVVDVTGGWVLAGGNFTGSGTSGTLDVTGSVTVSTGEFDVANPAALIDITGSLDNSAIIGGGGTYVAASLINSGQIIADGDLDFGVGAFGPLVIDAPISGSGAIEVDGDATINLNGSVSQGITIGGPFTSGSSGPSTVELGTNVTSTGPINFTAGSTLDLGLIGQSVAAGGATVSGSTLSVLTSSHGTETFTLAGGTGYSAAVLNPGATNAVVQVVVCFARGTRIATPDGEMLVEGLVPGDLVLTASGKARPIVWIGRRRTDCKRHPEPRQVLPIRIQAEAFGPGLPLRDLRVSPQHGIYLDGVLIPAKILANGSSVRQEHVAEIEYFHIELETHDILFAEGLPAESYLDCGDRASFENGGGALVLHPDFARWAWDGRACAQLKVVGPEVERAKAQLALRAKKLGPAVQEMESAAG